MTRDAVSAPPRQQHRTTATNTTPRSASLKGSFVTSRSPLLLAAVGVACLGLAAPAHAVTAPEDTGMLRLTHLSPGTDQVDVELSPFASSDTIDFTDVGYGEVSDYRSVSAGFYTLSVRPDDDPTAPAVVTARVEVAAGGAVTVAVTGSPDDIQALALIDDLTPPPAGQARVRLLQGADTAPTIDVQAVDGPDIASDVAFGTATGYANVPAGPWRLQITPTGGQAQPAAADVVLAAGSVQTVLALQGDDGLLAQVVVDAQSMAAMPSGGVQTGAGPAADQPVVLLGLAGLMGLGVMLTVLHRSRRPALTSATSTGRAAAL